jgi:hypothetical protein
LENSAIVEAKIKCSIGGVDKNGPRLKVTKEGIYDRQVVKFHENAAFNILFMSLLKSNDSNITFLEFSNVFLLLNVGSKVLHSFRARQASGSHGEFYICDSDFRINGLMRITFFGCKPVV